MAEIVESTIEVGHDEFGQRVSKNAGNECMIGGKIWTRSRVTDDGYRGWRKQKMGRYCHPRNVP